MSEAREEIGRDLEATIEARRELGREHETALVEAFLDRMEKRLAERQPATPSRRERDDARGQAFVLALASFGCGIPITAIAAGSEGLPGLAVAWAGIVLVNYVFNRRR